MSSTEALLSNVRFLLSDDPGTSKDSFFREQEFPSNGNVNYPYRFPKDSKENNHVALYQDDDADDMKYFDSIDANLDSILEYQKSQGFNEDPQPEGNFQVLENKLLGGESRINNSKNEMNSENFVKDISKTIDVSFKKIEEIIRYQMSEYDEIISQLYEIQKDSASKYNEVKEHFNFAKAKYEEFKGHIKFP